MSRPASAPRYSSSVMKPMQGVAPVYGDAASLGLINSIDTFKKELDREKESRDILARIIAEQKAWIDDKWKNHEDEFTDDIASFLKEEKETYGRDTSEQEAIDKLFLRHLKKENGREKQPRPDRETNLFVALDIVREAIDIAAEKQEKIYFNEQWDGTGTPWPLGATVITVPRNPDTKKNFDNEMTICIDGIELIQAHSTLIANDNSRENRLVSVIGKKNMKAYKNHLSDLFKIAGRGDVPEDILWKIAETMPDIGTVEEWILL